MSTPPRNNRSEDENKRIAAIARAAKAAKAATAKARAATKAAKVSKEYEHIFSTSAKAIEKPIPITTKPPVIAPIKPTTVALVKKRNTEAAQAARRERYEATREAREAKKAREQQIKKANREIRERIAEQKKQTAVKPSKVTAKPPASTSSVQPIKKKSNVGPALAARREKYEARKAANEAKKAANEAKKALEQQIKQANREIREHTTRQKKSVARKKVGEQFNIYSSVPTTNDWVQYDPITKKYMYKEIELEGREERHNRNKIPQKIKNEYNKLYAIELGEIREMGEGSEETNNKLTDILIEAEKYMMRADKPKEAIDNMPTDYPYYARAVIYTEYYRDSPDRNDTFKDKVFRTTKAYLIKDKHYAESFVNGIFFHDYDTFWTNVSGADILYTYPNGRQGLIKVARYKAGNCVMNILSGGLKSEDIKKIYKKLPHLIPTATCPNPFICFEDLKQINKTSDINFKIYSRLGAVINEPWVEIGNKKRKCFNLVFGNGHATIKGGTVRIDEIVYVRSPIPDPSTTGEFTDYVDIGYNMDAENNVESVNYYIRLTNGKYIIYKHFRPSTVTGDIKSDTDINYAYSCNYMQVLSRIFRKKYNLFKCKSDVINNVLKAAEFFVGRKRFGNTDYTREHGVTYEIDMNKCYVSYKNNKYYEEFPTTDLYPVRGEHPTSRFYICTVDNAPKAFKILRMYASGELVLTRPVVRWLRDNGATVNCTYSLVGPTRDVDLIAFADSYENVINCEQIKLFRNSMIGRTIPGGIQGNRILTCAYSDIAERDQLIWESSLKEYQITMGDNKLCIHYRADTKGAFQYHSFVLGYAFVSVCDMMQKILNSGGEILAYNVDAIVYKNGSGFEYSGDEYGGWKKTECPKDHYRKLEISVPEEKVYPSKDFFAGINVPEALVNTFISGPPGISKSYPFLVSPFIDSVFLTPRRKLRDTQMKTMKDATGHANVHTWQKYFQPGLDLDKWLALRSLGKIPGRSKVVIVDEANMLNSYHWEIVMERAKHDGSIVYALGDFEQICDEVESEAVDRRFFDEEGFVWIEKTRVDGAIARQNFTDGSILDTLRGKPWNVQVDLLKKKVKCINDDSIDFNNSIHISGTHARCHVINLKMKEWVQKNNKLMPCYDRKNKKIDVDVNSSAIWWDRKSMKDEMPKKFKYEPGYSVTADSVQGETLNCNIYVDSDIKRHGAFYTAVCRCINLSQVIIVRSKAKIGDPIGSPIWVAKTMKKLTNFVGEFVYHGKENKPIKSLPMDDIKRECERLRSLGNDELSRIRKQYFRELLKAKVLVKQFDLCGDYDIRCAFDLQNPFVYDDPAYMLILNEVYEHSYSIPFYITSIGRAVVNEIVLQYCEFKSSTKN